MMTKSRYSNISFRLLFFRSLVRYWRYWIIFSYVISFQVIPEKKENDIVQLLRARNELGKPLVIKFIAITDYESNLRLRLISLNGPLLGSQNGAEIEERLQFWLRMSYLASAPVKLVFRLQTDKDDSTIKNARIAFELHLLGATKEVPEAYFERQGDHIILRYKNAKVLINFISDTRQNVLNCKRGLKTFRAM
jgi:hypothetical protein